MNGVKLSMRERDRGREFFIVRRAASSHDGLASLARSHRAPIMTQEAIRTAVHRPPWYRILYVQVLIAIALGIVIGYFYPDLGKQLKPLGDGFIALIKMMIAPIIFCTVVHGISSMGDLKRVGRVGLKTLIYFETVSTVALAIGLLVGEILQPGRAFNIDPAAIDPKSVATYVTQAKEEGVVAHLLAIDNRGHAHHPLERKLRIYFCNGTAQVRR